AQLPLVLFGLAAAATLVYGLPLRGTRLPLWACVAFAAEVAYLVWQPPSLHVSEHKQLRLLLDLPDTGVVATRTGPLGLIHVVDGPTIRLVPGRSAAYMGREPDQRAILVDADSPSAINRITDPEQLEAFDYTTGALPYHLLDRPKTLIVGAGGGSDVLLARHHGCRSITALELNPQVAALMRGSQAEFAQHLYQQPEVRLVAAEARGFLAQTDERYDLIQLPLVESLGASGAGVAALNESYLYTVEAFEAYLDHLTPNGMLCITRWMQTPPSDVPRIFATLTEAMAQGGPRAPAWHIVAIRGMFTATILASRREFTDDEVLAAAAFCRERSFDPIWLPAATWEPNQYNALPEPYYYDAAAALLSGRREQFIRSYALDITPTTDDRPYHGLTFRWRAFRHLRQTMGEQWVRYVDWGYLVLVATLVQAVVAGLVLILVPLAFLRREREARGGRLATSVYFACLGVAFMFVEIAMMQKLSLFLASPIYSAAVVLTSFMVFSGLGSLASGRLGRPRTAATAGVLGIVLIGLLLWAWEDTWLGSLAGTSAWVRFPVAVAATGALAFFMGMPFPSGLRRVASEVPALAPWAWGVNGCGSVVGATLAMVLAVSVGFRAVLLLAFALYALAALALRGIRAKPEPDLPVGTS
ncbi:MAG: spermidine synthase, partial [Planctomycetota bacterium]